MPTNPYLSSSIFLLILSHRGHRVHREGRMCFAHHFWSWWAQPTLQFLMFPLRQIFLLIATEGTDKVGCALHTISEAGGHSPPYLLSSFALLYVIPAQDCHPCEGRGGNPQKALRSWIPAFAGMTALVYLRFHLNSKFAISSGVPYRPSGPAESRINVSARCGLFSVKLLSFFAIS